MGSPRNATFALLCTAAALCSCATKLDFDSVSDPSAVSDAMVPRADASTSAEDDVASPPDAALTALSDGGDASFEPALAADDGGAKPDGADAAVALPAPDAGAPDPASFSCKSLAVAPTFCDDFETGNLADHWSWTLVAPPTPPAGSIVIDTRAARAGKGALLVDINEGLTIKEYFAVLADKTFEEYEGKPIHVEVEFDVRVEQIDPGAGRRIMLFQFLFGTLDEGYNQLTLQLDSNGPTARARFLENDTAAPDPVTKAPGQTLTVSHDIKPTPNVNEWAHVRFVLDAENPSGNGNHASVKIDDVELFDGPLQYALRTLQPRIELGIPWVDTDQFTEQDKSKRWRVRYDNVLVRIQPR